jgi:hypothetical protein
MCRRSGAIGSRRIETAGAPFSCGNRPHFSRRQLFLLVGQPLHHGWPRRPIARRNTVRRITGRKTIAAMTMLSSLGPRSNRLAKCEIFEAGDAMHPHRRMAARAERKRLITAARSIAHEGPSELASRTGNNTRATPRAPNTSPNNPKITRRTRSSRITGSISRDSALRMSYTEPRWRWHRTVL